MKYLNLLDIKFHVIVNLSRIMPNMEELMKERIKMDGVQVKMRSKCVEERKINAYGFAQNVGDTFNDGNYSIAKNEKEKLYKKI